MNFKSATVSRYTSLLSPYRYHLLAIAALVIIGTLILKSNSAPKVAPKLRLVRIITLDKHYANTSHFTGTVHARVESDLSFQVSGKIIQKRVNQGQTVNKGEVLMRIDPIDLKLNYSAQTQRVNAAKAQNIRALKDEQRMRILLKEHAVSHQEYEKAKADADATSADLKAAVAQQHVANNSFGYAELKADSDGIIMAVTADVGQVVAAGQTVIRLAHNGIKDAVINLPEGSTNLAKHATSAVLYTDPTTLIPVTLHELSGVADPMTRTYQARYTLKTNNHNIALGSTITVNFNSAQESEDLSYEVPIGALYDNGNGSSVWLVCDKNSSVHMVPVRIIKLGEESARISGKLKPGDQVVALGAHLLKDNEQVRVTHSQGY